MIWQTLTIDAELHRRFRALCDQHDIPEKDAIEALLREALRTGHVMRSPPEVERNPYAGREAYYERRRNAERSDETRYTLPDRRRK